MGKYEKREELCTAYIKEGKGVYVKMPDGTDLPCIIDVSIIDNKAEPVCATIKLFVNLEP